MEERIRNLIEMYMEGRTSLEDEKVLHDYFCGNEVAEDLLPYKEMFVVIDEDIMALQDIAREPHSQKRAAKHATLFWTVSVAASLLLLFTFAWQKGCECPIDEKSAAAKAFAEVVSADSVSVRQQMPRDEETVGNERHLAKSIMPDAHVEKATPPQAETVEQQPENADAAERTELEGVSYCDSGDEESEAIRRYELMLVEYRLKAMDEAAAISMVCNDGVDSGGCEFSEI
ncbi:hypothetical protein E5358_03905 [Palleniella muris]|uniref:Uncharacterized protein n=1 Tax=Palleniella muris TaxID=3038145 RepID=A0AC61QSF1_9BACT|nr:MULTISPECIES: hypothetical protein [Palleniella]NPD81595.1 hypothetical protein [Palleniella intestinalis]TGX83408.1 hypothetical protein E5358_03905 [Palleniella muris]